MSDSVLAWSPEGQYSPVGAINMQSPGGCHAHDLECCHLRELPRQRKATDAVVWLHFLWRNGDTHGVENLERISNLAYCSQGRCAAFKQVYLDLSLSYESFLSRTFWLVIV